MKKDLFEKVNFITFVIGFALILFAITTLVTIVVSEIELDTSVKSEIIYDFDNQEKAFEVMIFNSNKRRENIVMYIDYTLITTDKEIVQYEYIDKFEVMEVNQEFKIDDIISEEQEIIQIDYSTINVSLSNGIENIYDVFVSILIQSFLVSLATNIITRYLKKKITKKNLK